MNVDGVIVRVTPYRESGGMINVLTKDKLISFYVKNIYKIDSKNSLLTSPLMYGSFTFSDVKKDLLTFKELTPIFDTRSYQSNYAQLAAIDFINEVTIRLFSETDMPKIYSYLITSLKAIKNINIIPLIILIYLANALKINGFGLNVDNCVLTNSTNQIIGVSYLDGGFITKSAYRPNKHKLYTAEKINLLRLAFKIAPNQMTKISFSNRDALEIIDDLLVYTYDQTGIRFKSEKLLRKI